MNINNNKEYSEYSENIDDDDVNNKEEDND